MAEKARYAYVVAARYARPSRELDGLRTHVWNIADEVFGCDTSPYRIGAAPFGKSGDGGVMADRLQVSSSYIYAPAEIAAVLFERRAEPGGAAALQFPEFVSRMTKLPNKHRTRTTWGKVGYVQRDNPVLGELEELAAKATKAGHGVLHISGVEVIDDVPQPHFISYALRAVLGPEVDALRTQRACIDDAARRLHSLGAVMQLSENVQLPVHLLPFAHVPEATELQHEEFLSRAQDSVVGTEIELGSVAWRSGFAYD